MDYIRKPLAYLRSESSVEGVMKLRLLLGHYYRSRYSTSIDYLFRLYVVVYTIAAFLAMVYFVSPGFYLSIATCIIWDFFFNILVSFISGQDYYLKFYAAVRNIDEVSGYCGPFISLRSYALMIFVAVAKLIVYCFQMLSAVSVYEPLVRGAMSLCLAVYYIPIVLVFDILHLRIKTLRQDLECGIRSDVISMPDKIDHLKRVIVIYNDLLDNFNENNLVMQISMGLSLLLTFPKEVILTYGLIEELLQGAYLNGISSSFIIMYNLANVCYPSIVAEMIIQETVVLGKYLSSQLVACEDSRLKREVNTALEIVSLRPFNFKILRAITVDGNLPKSFIILCVTYVIIMVQMFKFKN